MESIATGGKLENDVIEKHGYQRCLTTDGSCGKLYEFLNPPYRNEPRSSVHLSCRASDSIVCPCACAAAMQRLNSQRIST